MQRLVALANEKCHAISELNGGFRAFSLNEPCKPVARPWEPYPTQFSPIHGEADGCTMQVVEMRPTGTARKNWPLDAIQTCGESSAFVVTAQGDGECHCIPGYSVVPGEETCKQRGDDEQDDDECGAEYGNPINVMKGTKRQELQLGAGSVLDLALIYNTRSLLLDQLADFDQLPVPDSFGVLWGTQLHRRLWPGPVTLLARGDGPRLSFMPAPGMVWQPPAAPDLRLKMNTSDFSWLLTNVDEGRFEVYDAAGLLRSMVGADGSTLKLTYSDTTTSPAVAPRPGLLTQVSDRWGRTLQLHYEKSPLAWLGPRINQVVDVGVETTSFRYDSSGNLSEVRWPGGAVLHYLYERPDLPSALTGIVDENGQRHATYDYDAEGRAISTELAGGVDRFTVRWDTPPGRTVNDVKGNVFPSISRKIRWQAPVGTVVTLPNGQTQTLTADPVLEIPRVTRRDQPAGSGCSAASSAVDFDARGNVSSRVDFNGTRTCHAYDPKRQVESVRVEGLAQADRCPADLAAYTVPAGLPADLPQRKISTLWHPLWKLEQRRAEPGRITTTVYNGTDDPVTGERAIGCVPVGQPQPDGSPIAAVCRRYEQATTDETGSQGFLAKVSGQRRWRYEYNSYGQKTLEEDPRGQITRYAYYDDDVFDGRGADHSRGDLKSVTNALNQVTQFMDYDRRGQVRQIRHANGSLERRDYSPRTWLIKVTLTPAGGGTPQSTVYDYEPTGLLKRVTQPDGSYAHYTWDAAHRLTEVRDSLGNSVTYTLDNSGNRTKEEFKDPDGVLARTIERSFDNLGRMSSLKGVQP